MERYRTVPMRTVSARMWDRIGTVARTHLAGEWFGERGARLPIAPLLFHASLASLLCALARGELPPYGYGVFALSIPLALTTIPLLGELGPLLRADAAQEWIAAQPIRPFELRAARVLCLCVLLGSLALASLLPAALLADGSVTLGARLALVVAGLAQTAFVAALLLAAQALLGRRGDSVLVLLQTLLFFGVVVGSVAGLRLLPTLAAVDGPAGPLATYPPAWFATVLLERPFDQAAPVSWLAVSATVVAVVILLFAPFPPAPRSRRTHSSLAFLLTPFRRLATAVWVPARERASFDLVYDALPAERDFVIRTYPLVAIPVAFLLMGAQDGDPRGEGLLAILAFSPAIYLPVLLAHVPTTATPEARWIFETAPLGPRDEREGAIKAVALRFLFPLYVALAAIVWVRAGGDLALRLCLPSAAACMLAIRVVWPLCMDAPPLSTSPRELGSAWGNDFTGLLFTLAAIMSILAIVVWRFVDRPVFAIVIAATVITLELLWARRTPAVQSPG